MLECPDCGASNREGSKFCGRCGRPLEAGSEIACPMCDARNLLGSTACARCGARLVARQASQAGEPADLVAEGPAVIDEGASELAAGEAAEAEAAETIADAFPPSKAEPKEGIPPWLQKLREVPVEAPPAEPHEETRLPSAELPDWLEVPPELKGTFAEIGIVSATRRKRLRSLRFSMLFGTRSVGVPG